MDRKIILFSALVFFVSIISCSSSRKTVKIPQSRPLGENFTTDLGSSARGYHEEDVSAKQDTLTMAEAIRLVLLKNPELQAYAMEIRAKEARTLQESFAPNPQIEIEIEDFGGTGNYIGFNRSEVTFSVGQLFELADKRNKRKRAAAFQSDLAGWDYEAKKLDLLTETVKRYIQLIGDHELLLLNAELVSVSENLHQAVNKLVQAGKISAAEISRTQILLSKAQMELSGSRRKLDTDRSRLSSLWGETLPGFRTAAGYLDSVATLPSIDSLQKLLAENPDILRWATEMEMRYTLESLAEAKQIPDPTIQAGYRHLSELNINSFVVNLSIPIPIFNTNKGAVQEAFIRRKKAEELRKQTETDMRINLIELYQNLQTLYSEIDNSNKTIIPEAEKASQIINEGYLLGKFSFLDVLESQKTLFEARKNLILSLMEYKIRVADMERLIGRSLVNISHDQ